MLILWDDQSDGWILTGSPKLGQKEIGPALEGEQMKGAITVGTSPELAPPSAVPLETAILSAARWFSSGEARH